MDRRQEGVRAKSPKSIQLDFTYQGRRCRETIKLPPTKANLIFAANRRAAILHEIALGKFNYAEYFPQSPHASTLGKLTQKTIGEALEDFLRNTKRRHVTRLQERHLSPFDTCVRGNTYLQTNNK